MKQRRRKTTDRLLTELCRKLVVEIRDRNTCQKCGAIHRKLEWAHVHRRNAKSLIYVPWNSLALCGPRIYSWSCHHWFDSNKSVSLEWWKNKFPSRALALQSWMHNRNHRKVDREADRLYLEQKIRELE